MADLLLRTRMAALDANVQRVRRLLDAFKSRKEALEALSMLLEDQKHQARAIVDDLRDARRVLEDGKGDGLDLLERTENAANKFERQFGDLRKKVAALQSPSDYIFRNEKMGLGAAINTQMESRATALLESINEIQQQHASGQVGTEQAWTNYGERVHAQAQTFFAAYVDLIAGLALRNVGFDEGVCQLADELMSSYTFNIEARYELHAVPSRQRAVSMTWARIIRLGGPEWSLWALPFAGHEFWYVIAGKAIEGDSEVAGVDVSSPQMQECLADAFATYAMGPAYAHACVLLRLDPCSALVEDAEHAADDARAHAIFTMLKHMDTLRPEAASYEGLRRDLQAEWDRAVAYLRRPLPDPEKEAEELTRTIRKEQLTRAIDGVFKALQKRTFGGFSLDAWNAIQEWPEQLASANSAITVSPEHELRQVINAAWLARLKHPDKVPLIAKQAESLWKNVVEKNRNISGQGRSRPPDIPRPPKVGV